LADCLVDPVNQYYFAENAYATGIMDENTRDQLSASEIQLQQQMMSGNLSACLALLNVVHATFTDGLLPWVDNYRDYIPSYDNYPPTYVPRFNASMTMTSNSSSQYRQLFSLNSNYAFGTGDVFAPLANSDLGNQTVYAVEYLLEQGIDILAFCGQDDMNLGYVGHMKYLNAMNWSNIVKFRTSQRKVFYVNGSIAGLFKGYENLNFALINKAGHFATFDQPQNVLGAIDSFINNNWQTTGNDVDIE